MFSEAIYVLLVANTDAAGTFVTPQILLDNANSDKEQGWETFGKDTIDHWKFKWSKKVNPGAYFRKQSQE